MVTATMFEAKTKLSELVKRAQAGEEVVITSGREKKPVARLIPAEEPQVKRIGFMLTPDFQLTEAFWEPLSDEECGYADDDFELMPR